MAHSNALQDNLQPVAKSCSLEILQKSCYVKNLEKLLCQLGAYTVQSIHFVRDGIDQAHSRSAHNNVITIRNQS